MSITEKRVLPRTTTETEVHISFVGETRPEIPCVMRDFTQFGARLDCEQSQDLPNYFLVRIPDEKLLRVAEVRWRRAGSVGVEFVLRQPRAARAVV